MAAWLDLYPGAHAAICWTLFCAWIALSLKPLFLVLRRGSSLAFGAPGSADGPFILLLVATTLSFRLPVLLFGRELNPDESHLIAEALALKRDWFFWKVIDGTTHGPLDVYPLALARIVGLPLDYFTARLVATLALLTASIALYRAARSLVGEPLARLGLLPLACFVMFAADWDFAHYSSEQIPIALLGLGVALLLPHRDSERERSGWHPRWLLGGMMLGAVPLAKLQGGPLAATLLATVAGFELPAARPWRDRLARIGTLAFAALSLPVVFAAVALLRGVGSDVWRTYIVQNLVYAADRHHPPVDVMRRFWEFAALGPEYLPYAAGCAAFIGLTILRVPEFPSSVRRYAIFGAVGLAASVFVTVWPGRLYGHYLLWTVFPAGILAASLLAGWMAATERRRWSATWTALIFLAITVVPQVAHRASARSAYLGQLVASHEESALVRELKHLAPPGTRASIWGWSPRLYVQAGLIPSTRDAQTYNMIAWSPTIDYHRERYLRDLLAAPPELFIDAVGPGNFTFQDRALAHEMLPSLQAFVATHYRFVSEIDGTRIYVRALSSDR